LEIKFGKTKYEVYVDEFMEEGNQLKQARLFERLLHKPLTETETTAVATQLAEAIFKHIDYHTKKIGLR
jgi:hypothetical protein